MISINEILKTAVVDTPELVRLSSSWTHIDKITGEEITDNFDFWFVKSITFAAHRRVFSAAEGSKEDVIADRDARMLSESCRFGENGDERLSYDQVKKLDPAFAYALFFAIQKYQESEAEKAKKPSHQKTSSGTSLSSPGSVEKRSARRKRL
jgi:hypothetical protein